MTNAPEKIYASIQPCRDGWHQTVNLQGGQRAFPYSLFHHDDTVKELKSRIDVLTEALQEIRDYKLTVTSHWSGPSPEDELDATVPELEAEYMQEIASAALKEPQ